MKSLAKEIGSHRTLPKPTTGRNSIEKGVEQQTDEEGQHGFQTAWLNLPDDVRGEEKQRMHDFFFLKITKFRTRASVGTARPINSIEASSKSAENISL